MATTASPPRCKRTVAPVAGAVDEGADTGGSLGASVEINTGSRCLPPSAAASHPSRLGAHRASAGGRFAKGGCSKTAELRVQYCSRIQYLRAASRVARVTVGPPSPPPSGPTVPVDGVIGLVCGPSSPATHRYALTSCPVSTSRRSPTCLALRASTDTCGKAASAQC